MEKTFKLPIIASCSPCETIRVSSFYGYRIHPITKRNTWHAGVDIASSGYLYAPFDGTVVDSYYNKTRGYVLVIQYKRKKSGYYVRFLAQHLAKNSIKVKEKDKVIAGQKIATIGSTGSSTGVHLHFEIHVSKDNKTWKVVNPIDFLAQLPSHQIKHTLTIENDEKRDGYVLEVKKLQECLNKLYKKASLTLDGLFGANTEKWVKQFQKDNKLVIDGMFGPSSLKILREKFKDA